MNAPVRVRVTSDAPVRVRLTTAARPFPETVLEPDPGARLGKRVVDLPAVFVARFTATQQAWWRLQAELAVLLGERPGGGAA